MDELRPDAILYVVYAPGIEFFVRCDRHLSVPQGGWAERLPADSQHTCSVCDHDEDNHDDDEG